MGRCTYSLISCVVDAADAQGAGLDTMRSGDLGQQRAEQTVERLLRGRRHRQQLLEWRLSGERQFDGPCASSPNGDIAAIILGSARGSERSSMVGSPRRPEV